MKQYLTRTKGWKGIKNSLKSFVFCDWYKVDCKKIVNEYLWHSWQHGPENLGLNPVIAILIAKPQLSLTAPNRNHFARVSLMVLDIFLDAIAKAKN